MIFYLKLNIEKKCRKTVLVLAICVKFDLRFNFKWFNID